MNVMQKLKWLRSELRQSGGAVIAFSGGVDSTFLAAVAAQELGRRAFAVTAVSPTYPVREQKEAARLASRVGIHHETVDSNELLIPGFSRNPVDRCYHCKRELFKVLRGVARRRGVLVVADGTNADDLDDYRPGRRAAREAGVWSPLAEAGLGKRQIRRLSRSMKLPTAEKPSLACLASRFPYGSSITEERLKVVDKLEGILRHMGFRQVRVRHHGEIARIEVEPRDIPRLCVPRIRTRVAAAVRAAGFSYAAVDLEGYRTGSMNIPLRKRWGRSPEGRQVAASLCSPLAGRSRLGRVGDQRPLRRDA